MIPSPGDQRLVNCAKLSALRRPSKRKTFPPDPASRRGRRRDCGLLPQLEPLGSTTATAGCRSEPGSYREFSSCGPQLRVAVAQMSLGQLRRWPLFGPKPLGGGFKAVEAQRRQWRRLDSSRGSGATGWLLTVAATGWRNCGQLIGCPNWAAPAGSSLGA